MKTAKIQESDPLIEDFCQSLAQIIVNIMARHRQIEYNGPQGTAQGDENESSRISKSKLGDAS